MTVPPAPTQTATRPDPSAASPGTSGPTRCGTYGGYQQHAKAHETPCDPCRLARNKYMQNLRARGGAREDPDIRRARNRALTRLAAEHPDQMRILLIEELARCQAERTPA